MNRFILSFIFFFYVLSFQAQVTYNANSIVKPYSGTFAQSMNLTYAPPFVNEQLGILSAGSTDFGVEGVGIKALRSSLPENFTEVWGYNFQLQNFQFYEKLGMKDHTSIVGFPAEWHRDQTFYCPTIQSDLFSNLYTDIWDGGANGTPYNDNNYYAAYLYKTVSTYKKHIKFWEIWNEPGFDFTGNKGWRPKGDPNGNWWDQNPNPCDYKLHAPIFHFIRILRISYDIIKTVDPEAYVVLSGVGFPSFLDAVLRNTDNPTNGAVSTQYPLKGGAYFDVIGFHSYPHFDNSLREWDNATSSFKYYRHSDAAAEGIDRVKKSFQDVLTAYGYTGATYPNKLWIITECNVPRKAFSFNWGSDLIQRNFIAKAYIQCIKSNFLQNHIYKIGEDKSETEAKDEFEMMGFYKKLDGNKSYFQDVTEGGIASKTCTDLLYGKTFDQTKTNALLLPNNVGGGAFSDATGKTTYVLWAKTQTDLSENAAATYSFPTNLGFSTLSKKEWNYGYTHQATNVAIQNIALNATPVFFTTAESSDNNYVDLSIAQSTDRQIVSLNDIVNITLTVRNNGVQNATEVLVRNLLPTGFSLVSSNGGTAFSNNIWTVGDLAVNAQKTLTIQAKVITISKTVSNFAQIIGLAQTDKYISNNGSALSFNPSSTVPPTGKTDIELSLTADQTDFTVGRPFTYTITTINQQTATATNIVIKLPLLKPNLTYQTYFATKGTYDPNTQLWTIPTLGGQYQNATLKLTFMPTSKATVVNFIEVQSQGQSDDDSIPNNGKNREDDESQLTVPNDGNPCFDDDIAPIFVECPKDVTLQTSSDNAKVYWAAPTIKENCGYASIQTTHQSGAFFPLGTSNVTLTATDSKGNKSTCSFNITIQKTTTGGGGTGTGGGTSTPNCISRGKEPWQEWIARVQLNTIDNTTQKDAVVLNGVWTPGYGDYTAKTTSLEKGKAYPITLTPALSYPTYATNLFWRVWADWNNDGDFDDAGEQVFEKNNGNQGVSGTITVPPTAITGNVKMRVSMKKDAFPTSCEVFDKGEVEDYTLQISGTTTGGGGTGTGGGGTSTPNCISRGKEPWQEWIARVQLNTIDNTTQKDAVVLNGVWTPGYGDYTAKTTSLEKGKAYPITLTPALSYPTYATNLFWRVWADWNNDGDFDDAGEQVFEKNNGNQGVSGTITVPTTAITGNVKMRVSMKKDAFPTSCEVFDKGEVEDYTLQISGTTTGGGGTGTGGGTTTNFTYTFDTDPTGFTYNQWGFIKFKATLKDNRIAISNPNFGYTVRFVYDATELVFAQEPEYAPVLSAGTFYIPKTWAIPSQSIGANLTGTFTLFSLVGGKNITITANFYENDQLIGTIPLTIQPKVVSRFALNAGLKYNIFPNPTNDIVQINFDADNEFDANMRIIDQLGRILIHEKTTFIKGINNPTLSLEHLPSGTYFLTISKDNQVIMAEKVVKE